MILDILQIIFSAEFFYASIRMTTPLLLAAMGGLLAERAGVLILSLEGMMVAGAFFGFYGGYITGSVWFGVLLAMIGGALIGLVYAIATVSFNANQVVAAVGVNMLAVGVTSVIFRGAFVGGAGQATGPQFLRYRLHFLSDIPIIGDLFFNHIPLVYLAAIVFVLVYLFFKYTDWGLKVKAVGEHPLACESVGISVTKVRYLTIIVCGLIAGIAGSTLSLGYLNRFVEGMVSGRGWIAFSAIILGGWQPVGTLIASFIFGAANALQIRIQAYGLNIPFQFLLMLPYLVTLLSLFIIGKVHSPAAQGQPYSKE